MQIRFKTVPTTLFVLFSIDHFILQRFSEHATNYNYWIVFLLFMIWAKFE
jgi:hypothetical protein